MRFTLLLLIETYLHMFQVCLTLRKSETAMKNAGLLYKRARHRLHFFPLDSRCKRAAFFEVDSDWARAVL